MLARFADPETKYALILLDSLAVFDVKVAIGNMIDSIIRDGPLCGTSVANLLAIYTFLYANLFRIDSRRALERIRRVLKQSLDYYIVFND